MTSPAHVLVTGADGCVGRAIVAGLRATGLRVHGQVFAREAAEDETRLDLTRTGATAALPADIDAVVHAAGNVNPRVSTQRMFAINAGGTQAMLDWSAHRGVSHFVQISSVSVYGSAATGLDRREATTPRRRLGVAYARSKAAAEVLVERSNLPYTLLRLPMVIGPGDVFATPILCTALAGGRFFLSGDGAKAVSLATTPNLGTMIAAVLARGPAMRALNFADHHVPWHELTRCYAEALGVPYAPRRARPWPDLWRMGASEWAFLYLYGRRGGEFPTAELAAHACAQPLVDWRQVVAAAVQRWRRTATAS